MIALDDQGPTGGYGEGRATGGATGSATHGTTGRGDGHEAEAELVRLAESGSSDAVRRIIKVHNQRLFRLVRAVAGNAADAEDILQEAYLHAFSHLGSYRADSSLATWLSRIALNAAYMRLRTGRRLKRRPGGGAGAPDLAPELAPAGPAADPERRTAQREILHLAEQAADALPADFRLVFVARVIEGLSQAETAVLLQLPQATVKTRLHRARNMIRTRVEDAAGPVMTGAFPFAGTRCERLTQAVVSRLGL